MAIPLVLIAFNVSKLDKIWRQFTAWGPIRKRFWPNTEGKFPIYTEIARGVSGRE